MISLRNSFRNAAATMWACLVITMDGGAASESILFDFQGGTNSPTRQIVNDDRFPGSLTPARVLTVPGAPGAKAISQQ